jgi:hypothetical protein
VGFVHQFFLHDSPLVGKDMHFIAVSTGGGKTMCLLITHKCADLAFHDIQS